MQSYKGRAWHDAREWFSPKDLVWAIVPGLLAFGYYRLSGSDKSVVHDALVAVVIAIAAAVLIPFCALGYFFIRAPFKMLREEVEHLRVDLEELKKPSPEDSILSRLRELQTKGKLLQARGPSLKDTAEAPAGFDKSVEQWIDGVDSALSAHPDLQEEWRGEIAPNPLLAALADPVAGQISQRMNVLEIIIKSLEVR